MQVKRIDSTNTDVSKYVFDFDTAVAEAVLYRYGSFHHRTVVCISTQSGCPVGCRFCGAGDAFIRNLSPYEIIFQVEQVFRNRQIKPEKVLNGQIMFMSMGEPLLNMKPLTAAILKLNKKYPNFSLLISTSAPRVDYIPLRSLSQVVDKVGLQFSVHESTNEARNKLIPFQQKLTLEEIAIEGMQWHHATRRRPFFNYCAHADNTSNSDANRLYQLFSPDIWNATVSVICERDESVSAANERQRDLAQSFMSKLNNLGYNTRCFDPAGQDDIGGGCGQLWFVQNWMQQHQQYVTTSCGASLPKVHTPKESNYESCGLQGS